MMTPISPRSFRVLLTVPLLWLAACGKKSDTPDGTPTVDTTPITAAKFAEEFTKAVCNRSQVCGSLAPYLVEECKTQQNELLHAEDVQKAIAAGRLVYDEAKARECVNGLASLPCLQFQPGDEVLAACFAALKGQVQKGAPCSFYYECASGYCGGTPDNTCPSTCPEEVLTEGQECSNFRGPKCDVQAGLRCSGGTCVKPVDQGAACIDNNGCKSGLVCVADGPPPEDGSEQKFKCVPLGKEGAGCSEDASCADGFYCLNNLCAPRKHEGEPCGVGPDEVNPALRLAQCADGLVCKGAGLDSNGDPLSGTCVKPTAEGGACVEAPAGSFDFLSGCLLGLSCVGGTCALPPSSGECPSSGCRPDVSYCDSDTNMCVTRKPDGAACNIPPDCLSRNCADGICAPDTTYCHE